MDPFIEDCKLWADFHDDLINEIKRALAQAVPPRYVVRTGERSYVVLIGSEGKDRHPFLPDVRVDRPRPAGPAGGITPGTAVAEAATSLQPVPMRPFIEEEFRENFVEVTDAENGNRLVTCVEVL